MALRLRSASAAVHSACEPTACANSSRWLSDGSSSRLVWDLIDSTSPTFCRALRRARAFCGTGIAIRLSARLTQVLRREETSVKQAFYLLLSSLEAADHRLFDSKCRDLLVQRSATRAWQFALPKFGATPPRMAGAGSFFDKRTVRLAAQLLQIVSTNGVSKER